MSKLLKLITKRRANHYCTCRECLLQLLDSPKDIDKYQLGPCLKKFLEMIREGKGPGAMGNLTGGKWG